MMSRDTAAITLDDESLAMLLDEVSAMAACGRPLVPGLADLDDRSIGKLGRAANAVRASLAQGRSATESIAALSRTYKAPVRLAMEVMADTGSTDPIDETVRLIREANEDRHQLRFASINPMLNVIVAATILFFVMPWILVSLSEAELIKTSLSPSITEICQTFAQDFFLAAMVTISVIGLFAWVLYRGLSRSSSGVDRFRDHATFCRWIAIQVRSSNPADSQGDDRRELGRVIGASAEVVGPAFAESWAGVIRNLRGGATSLASLAMPTTTPDPVERCIAELVSGSRDSKLIAYDLRRLSDLYTQKSRRRRTWWTEILPRWVAWSLMIAIIVILLQAIVTPLLDVVSEVLR